MNAVFINLLYIAASILFIFGIKMLGSADTARRGNQLSSIGMLLAIVATVLYFGFTWWMVVAGILVGASIGAIAATRVQMTGMPEMVALFNGFGGIASLLVGAAEFTKIRTIGMEDYLHHLKEQSGVVVPDWFALAAIGLTVLIGGVTFTGSLVAYGKLSGKLGGKPTLFPGQKALNMLVLATSLAGVALIVWGGGQPSRALRRHRAGRAITALRRADDHSDRRRRHAGGHLAFELVFRHRRCDGRVHHP